jgi:two-component system sensor histidine kinase NblS
MASYQTGDFLSPPAEDVLVNDDSDPVPQFVRVEVADTGIGIDFEDQNAIFDRFFRVENRVHTLEGTGLGLSIVRNIIEKHSSRVHLVSEVGRGTTFWFDLRVFQEQSVADIGNTGKISTEEIPQVPLVASDTVDPESNPVPA